MSNPFPIPNPSLRWFRAVVWMMPTCLAFTTLLLTIWLRPRLGISSEISLSAWGALNLATTYALGVLDGKLGRSERPPDEIFPPQAQFLFLQLGLVPASLLAMAGVRFLFR